MPQGQNNNGMPMPNPTPSMSMNANMAGVQGAPTMSGGTGGNMMGGAMPSPAPAMAGTPAAPVPPMPKEKSSVASIVILVVVCLIAAAAIVVAVIFFMRWNELNRDYESNKALEVAEAVAEQVEVDNTKFAEKEKEPYASFNGPSDYGSIYFEYPKTWNVYIASDGTNSTDFEAYFSPVSVPSIEKDSSRYALRFIIRNQSVDSIQRDYTSMVSDGLVTQSAYTVQGISGTLFKGVIDDNINGEVFVAKINDKTLIMQTDSTAHYENDFTSVISKLRRS